MCGLIPSIKWKGSIWEKEDLELSDLLTPIKTAVPVVLKLSCDMLILELENSRRG